MIKTHVNDCLLHIEDYLLHTGGGRWSQSASLGCPNLDRMLLKDCAIISRGEYYRLKKLAGEEKEIEAFIDVNITNKEKTNKDCDAGN